jgi:hypothetical protein
MSAAVAAAFRTAAKSWEVERPSANELTTSPNTPAAVDWPALTARLRTVPGLRSEMKQIMEIYASHAGDFFQLDKIETGDQKRKDRMGAVLFKFLQRNARARFRSHRSNADQYRSIKWRRTDFRKSNETNEWNLEPE